MTIIIETPAPPTRERLVLVPPDSCTPVFYDGKPAGLSIRAQGARDATPEDLARAGYVPAFSDLEASRDHYRDAHLHAIARAERAEREREECESVLTAMGARAREAEEFARVLEVERDTLRAELERVYSAAYARAWESEVSTPDRGERAGLRAVAAHVRQERCLVARAVDAHMSTHVYRRGPDDWAVALGPRFVECEPADVPATLARLLGEVAR